MLHILLRQDGRMQQHSGTIVLVEDDAGLNRAVVRLLEAAGFRSYSFDSAEELLASSTVRDADCFVFDVNLPGISGPELRAKLTKAGLTRPVIFITAHDDQFTRDVTRSASSVLTKPFTGRSLIQAIESALHSA